MMHVFRPLVERSDLLIVFIFMGKSKKGMRLQDFQARLKIVNLIGLLREMQTIGACFRHLDKWYITHIGQEYFTKVVEPALTKQPNSKEVATILNLENEKLQVARVHSGDCSPSQADSNGPSTAESRPCETDDIPASTPETIKLVSHEGTDTTVP